LKDLKALTASTAAIPPLGSVLSFYDARLVRLVRQIGVFEMGGSDVGVVSGRRCQAGGWDLLLHSDVGRREVGRERSKGVVVNTPGNEAATPWREEQMLAAVG